MAENRKASTTKIGTADYAKVAERLKLFREDNPHGKQESAYEVDVDGSLVFTVWLWKNKEDLLELMKAGITDKDALRSSADANGNAKGAVAGKEKDFEKLESIALGRALANLGYLASGEIASFEEVEEFNRYKKEQQELAVADTIERMKDAKTIEDVRKVGKESGLLNVKEVIEFGRKRVEEIQKAQDNREKEATDAS